MAAEPAVPMAAEERLQEAVLAYLAEVDAGRPPDPAAFLAEQSWLGNVRDARRDTMVGAV